MPYRLATPLYRAASLTRGRPEPQLRPFRLILVGWVKGLEPSTPGTTIRCSSQLSYTHHIERAARPQAVELARLKGFEPLTHCLEGSCSIHLSYRRIWSG